MHESIAMLTDPNIDTLSEENEKIRETEEQIEQESEEINAQLSEDVCFKILKPNFKSGALKGIDIVSRLLLRIEIRADYF
ncbi:unnamed protein product [Moneuplotes crassus]|uniref:Uncharacterized protein n=1 Tax=Euplotes crassus TaxID=5936 RepID=A0AAD1XEM2_EUPCR|nr:unnamed protein product [Moneuplotes crassus]